MRIYYLARSNHFAKPCKLFCISSTPSVRPFAHSFVLSSVRPSVRPSIQPAHPSVLPSIRPFASVKALTDQSDGTRRDRNSSEMGPYEPAGDATRRDATRRDAIFPSDATRRKVGSNLFFVTSSRDVARTVKHRSILQ